MLQVLLVANSPKLISHLSVSSNPGAAVLGREVASHCLFSAHCVYAVIRADDAEHM
jgi:hypothetical protein